MALDADEMLSANWSESPEWETALQAPPGTVLRFQWANVMPDLRTCWIPPDEIPFGYVDDESEHRGSPIHSTRVPVPTAAPSIIFRDIKVLHYQYTDWQRMKSKQRWYQCWEFINNPGHGAVGIYRQYHRMDAIPGGDLHPLRREWLAAYHAAGIDMTTTLREGWSSHDRQSLDLLIKYGARKFRKGDVWDVNWEELAQALGYHLEPGQLSDPRNAVEKLVHSWLNYTQLHRSRLDVRILQRALKALGW
jgi:hypothetical protein